MEETANNPKPTQQAPSSATSNQDEPEINQTETPPALLETTTSAPSIEAPDIHQKGSFFKPDTTNNAKLPDNDKSLTWSAAEFHEHEKTASWYLGLAVITVIVAAFLYLITKGIVTGIVIIVSGLLLGIFGRHRPGQLDYVIDRRGIKVGKKLYFYDEFRFFIVTPQSSMPEVTLVPTKRFRLPVSVRYTPDVASKVISRLSDYLPYEERRPDLIDGLMQRIKF